MVNFCRREQGLAVAKGNPLGITGVADIEAKKLTVVNRSLDTSTRILFDRELQKAGLQSAKIKGYGHEVARHFDVGLEVLCGQADIGPTIRPVAALLGLDFISLGWERFDLLVPKEHFFDQGVQLFLGLLHEPEFRALVDYLPGYDLELTGKMVYPNEGQ